MSAKVDWRALSDLLGTITFIEGGHSQLGGTHVGKRALNEIIGNEIAADAVDFFVAHGPGDETARSVLQLLRPPRASERCLEIFRADPNSNDANEAMLLMRDVACEPVLAHFDELMASNNPAVRANVIRVLDGLWMAGELEVENGWIYLEQGINDPDEMVRKAALQIKEMWDEEAEYLAREEEH